MLLAELTSLTGKFILNSTDFGFAIKNGKFNDTHHLLSVTNDDKGFTFSVISYPKLRLLETIAIFKLENGQIRKESMEISTNGTFKLIVVTFQQLKQNEMKSSSISIYVDCVAKGSFNLPFNMSSILSGGHVSIVSWD